MAEKKKCRACGVDIPSNAPLGACPRCVLELAFEAMPREAVDPNERSTIETATVTVTEEPGDYIDRYKLLQKIGEGGFGVVYMAEQEEPIRRRVALKILKLGMDTRSVIARFEAERQALAMMNHPNIAKVFDAGQTTTGRPFFVMELVQGVRITDYCDQNRLSTRDRLGLFTQVCQAIQHAHQKGIIHRDIKPSNVLVTLHDGVPVPKVIDFGIAKALHQQSLTDLTLFTAFGQFIGTAAYMSPEQAEMSGLDIDTRCDIYALGVLLYELLVGETPFDAQRLVQAGLDEMRRIIREEEPVRPSTRLTTLTAGELTAVANQQQCEPAKLGQLVRGDLDWIVMKCLEKDRTRRYDSAKDLATDIACHLDNEPILARPPTNLYRFQKMVWRNRVAFAAVAAVVTVFLFGGVLSAWQAVRATRAEREQSRLRIDAEMAKRKAEEGQQAAERAQQQVQEILYASDLFLAQRTLTESNLENADAIIQGLSQAILRRQDSLELRRSYAVMLQRKGKFNDAIEAFGDAIAVASTNSDQLVLRDILIRRSQLFRQLNRGAEAGIDERRAYSLPWQHIPIGAFPDYQNASEVSLEFGKTNRESGLYFLKPGEQGDSKYVLAETNGDYALFFPKGLNYAYFFIDPTFKWKLGSNVAVKVQYRSLAGHALGLHYDSQRDRYSSAFKFLQMTPTGVWQVLEFKLRDARLQNGEKWGADFRLYDNEKGFYLKKISLSRYDRRSHYPPRDPSISSNLIDLTLLFNVRSAIWVTRGDMETLPQVREAVRQRTGVDFDIRGIIALHRQNEESDGARMPMTVSIPLSRHARKVHFLQCASYGETLGKTIGSYIIHMSDGSNATIPIIYGQNVRSERGDFGETPEAQVAWEGEGARTGAGTRVRVYLTTWVNPTPDVALTSLEFTSTGSRSAPELLGLTVE